MNVDEAYDRLCVYIVLAFMLLVVLWLLAGCSMDRGPPCYTRQHIELAARLGYLGGKHKGYELGCERGYQQCQMDILGYVPDVNERKDK